MTRSMARVGKNTAARLAAQVWAKLLSMVLVALVARYDSAAGLGRYVLILTMITFAGALSDLGLNIYLTREVARQEDAQSQRALLGSVLPVKVLLSVVGAAGLVAFGLVASFPPATEGLIPFGSLLLLPEGAIGAARAFVNGRQRMEVSGAIDMTVRLVAVAASFPILVLGFGVAGVLVCSLGASLLGVLLYGIVLWRWHALPGGQSSPVPLTLSPEAWRGHLAESYPFALTAVAAALYARIDLVLLGLWQGELAAGWYGAAYKLWETVGLLPASLLEAMFPEMSRLAARPEGRTRLRQLFGTSSRAMLAGGALLSVGGVLTAGILIPLVYGGGDFAPAVLPFRLLACAIPAVFLYLLSGHVLYALGRQRRVTVVMIVVGLLNLALNLVVIPRWSYLGAAVVALLTEWLLVALLYPQAWRALAHEFATAHSQ
ncbi:MAG TPA: flippase [Anaerolineae bacterium]|nr:flippase [Anaerolineae bacterium]